ncbi:MAG: hypothetical protein ACYC54_15945 [Sedimentisphaerales bacterium]
MNDRIEKKLNNMPEHYRNNYKKAVTGRNRAAAVKAFCLECMGWQRTEIKNCDCVACPLYSYRPIYK